MSEIPTQTQEAPTVTACQQCGSESAEEFCSDGCKAIWDRAHATPARPAAPAPEPAHAKECRCPKCVPAAKPDPPKKPGRPAAKKEEAAPTPAGAAPWVPDRPLTLAAKLAAVMAEATNLDKGGWNDFHRYSYVEASEVVGALRPLLAKHGVAFQQTLDTFEQRESIDEKGKTTRTTFTTWIMRFLDGETGEVLESRWPGEAQDRGDKGSNKAGTAARKYFLLANLLIGAKEEDADEAPAPAPKPAPVQVRQPKPPVTGPNGTAPAPPPRPTAPARVETPAPVETPAEPAAKSSPSSPPQAQEAEDQGAPLAWPAEEARTAEQVAALRKETKRVCLEAWPAGKAVIEENVSAAFPGLPTDENGGLDWNAFGEDELSAIHDWVTGVPF